jgi:dipeptidyl-peptidase 4
MRIRHVTFAAVIWLALPLSAVAQQRARFASLTDALGASGALAGRSGPRGVTWIEGGRRFSFIAPGASGADEIRAMDPVTGRDTLLFTAAGVSFPDTAAPFAYQSFQWARDSRHLVFQTRFRPIYRNSGISDYYLYSLTDRTMVPAARDARTAELSPDGSMMGIEKGGDMYVYDLAQRRERRLTTGASEYVYNGHFDWVYEEEFGLTQAWSWSPDSRYIAFWQTDERPLPNLIFSDMSGRHPRYDTLRIPQPGDSNSFVRIGIATVRGGAGDAPVVWLDPGETGSYYIPRIYWTSHADTLAMITLNRAQNTMKLYFFDVRSGGRRLVMTETSRAWIDVYDFFAGIRDLMTFPAGSREFFWISDRDGWQHIYRYDYSGRLINQVTRGSWSVTRVEGIDTRGQTIYYVGTEVTPLQRQLYAIRFDGTGARRITQTAGTHAIDMSPDTRFFIDRWSSTSRPRQVELWETSGPRMLRRLEDNAQVLEWVRTHAYSPTELFTFTTSDGVRIDGSLIKPPDFDPNRRYPVIFSIYGSPGSQQVYDSWGSSGWAQWLAQQGYIVVGLNHRGSNNYGAAHMKVVYGWLGRWEAHDFAEAARYLARQPWVDGARVGIMGTSYGGYATLYAMARYPDVFSVGIANSPVTDWRLYDTIYTERYMGLLPENRAGYDSASVLVNVPRIRGRVMLVHSLLDDNVHVNHSMQFLTAMANAGKDVDVRLFPPGRHGAVYNQPSRNVLYQAMDEYLARYLGPRAMVP